MFTIKDQNLASNILTIVEFNEEALMVGNLMVSASLPTSLEVSWSLPVYGCSAVGYRIYYSMADSMEDKESSEFSFNSFNAWTQWKRVHDLRRALKVLTAVQ